MANSQANKNKIPVFKLGGHKMHEIYRESPKKYYAIKRASGMLKSSTPESKLKLEQAQYGLLKDYMKKKGIKVKDSFGAQQYRQTIFGLKKEIKNNAKANKTKNN